MFLCSSVFLYCFLCFFKNIFLQGTYIILVIKNIIVIFVKHKAQTGKWLRIKKNKEVPFLPYCYTSWGGSSPICSWPFWGWGGAEPSAAGWATWRHSGHTWITFLLVFLSRTALLCSLLLAPSIHPSLCRTRMHTHAHAHKHMSSSGHLDTQCDTEERPQEGSGCSSTSIVHSRDQENDTLSFAKRRW